MSLTKSNSLDVFRRNVKEALARVGSHFSFYSGFDTKESCHYIRGVLKLEGAWLREDPLFNCPLTDGAPDNFLVVEFRVVNGHVDDTFTTVKVWKGSFQKTFGLWTTKEPVSIEVLEYEEMLNSVANLIVDSYINFWNLYNG